MGFFFSSFFFFLTFRFVFWSVCLLIPRFHSVSQRQRTRPPRYPITHFCQPSTNPSGRFLSIHTHAPTIYLAPRFTDTDLHQSRLSPLLLTRGLRGERSLRNKYTTQANDQNHLPHLLHTHRYRHEEWLHRQTCTDSGMEREKEDKGNG